MNKTLLTTLFLLPICVYAAPGEFFFSGHFGLMGNGTSTSQFDYSITHKTTPNITLEYQNNVDYSNTFIPFGLSLGYQWQFTQWYIGFAANTQLNNLTTDNKTQFDIASGSFNYAFVDHARVKSNGFGFGSEIFTGYKLSSDAAVFIDAGAVYQQINFQNTLTLAQLNPITIDNGSKSLVGLQAGLGFSEMLNSVVSLTGEYKYTTFPQQTFQTTTRVTENISLHHKNSYDIYYQSFQLGLKYKF